MKLEPIEFLPERVVTSYKKLDGLFNDFMQLSTKYVKVNFDKCDYVSEYACRGSFNSYLRRRNIDDVDVQIVNGDVYFVRTDL
jgi:hypothetical protein